MFASVFEIAFPSCVFTLLVWVDLAMIDICQFVVDALYLLHVFAVSLDRTTLATQSSARRDAAT